jgi:hypothetical protein
MSTTAFVLTLVGVVALWSIANSLDDIAFEVRRFREQLVEED